MAEKLSEAELRRNATDFDPPVAPEAHHAQAVIDTKETRFRVTASLTLKQHTMLQALSARMGLPMSRVLGEAVEALGERY